jgi:hypothetical protein
MGGFAGEDVREEDYRKVLAHLNMGLKELYKRFFLSSKELIVQLYDHISLYKLHSRYAVQNKLSSEPLRWIMDSEFDPFQDDILKIEEIFNSDGCKVCLNDLNEPCSLFTPYYDTIQVPMPFKGSIISVHYRATHPLVRYNPTMDPKDIDINLPEGLLEALLLYIGYRAVRSQGGEAAQEGMNYLEMFEASCAKARDLGLQITPQYSNLKLDYRGWV